LYFADYGGSDGVDNGSGNYGGDDGDNGSGNYGDGGGKTE
jgi:hypothetical protein